MRTHRKKIIFAQQGSIARVLFYLNTILWLVISIGILVDMLLDNNGLSMLMVGFFLLVNIAAMFFSGRMLDQKEKWTYIFALVAVVLNIGLAFTGVPELLYVTALVFDGIILWVLISLRKIYFK
ncbi:MAG: hypothetical protein HZB18_00030 [Chloroflexi bacterium]|nr:hypothetical protein [Chloroflexota bacterium]